MMFFCPFSALRRERRRIWPCNFSYLFVVRCLDIVLFFASGGGFFLLAEVASAGHTYIDSRVAS